MNTDRFKFRAWDTYCNRMRYEEDYAIVPDTGKPHWIHDQELIQREATQLILMQCTGLKDIEGNLIYEGDILIRSKNKNSPFKAIVEWGWGGFRGVTVPYRNHSIPLSEIQTMQGAEYDLVVGNIYENKDLLNETVQK